MAIKTDVFMAVRRATDDGHEWVDIAAASGYRDEAARKARETDAKLPQWAAANPVVRVPLFTLTEHAS